MRRRRLALPAPRRSSCSPGGALPGSRVCCAHGRVRAHGRAWRSRERGRDGGRALTRSVSSPRPRTRVWLCRWPGLTVDGGSLSRSRSPPSTPAACLTAPQRPAGVSPLSRPAVPFRFWGVVRVPSPVGGRGAPRVGVPPPPSRRGSRARVPDGAGVVRGVANGRVGAAAVLPPASSTPEPCPGT